jgi:aryl-alcohol dehydrogenase-like predicted oxidoreductase
MRALPGGRPPPVTQCPRQCVPQQRVRTAWTHATDEMPRRIAPLLAALAVASASEQTYAQTCTAPRIVIGCWQLLERHNDPALAVETLLAYVRAGFTHFDTADIYGASESLLGEAKRRLPDQQPIIHTKYVTQDAGLENARSVNGKSRATLQQVPDLVAFHWWDYSDSRFVDAARHLMALRDEGSLNHIGACNFDVPHLQRLVEAGIPLVSNQVQYSILDRRPENGMLDYAAKHHIQLACFGAVGGGWLSDKWLGVDKPPRQVSTVSMRMYRRSLEAWSGGNWQLFQELLSTMRSVADAHEGGTIAAVAIAWVQFQLARPRANGSDGPGGWVILGVRDTSHLVEHVQTRDMMLSEEDDARIAAVLAKGHTPVGDIWSVERG